MNATPENERAPLVWSRVLMFVLTFAVAVTVVPWYGFTYGFSAAGWVWFAVLLYANGLAITTGYHRLWSHKTFDAHWSVRLVLMLFGSMALQNSVLHWAANHRVHHQHVDDDERDPYSAGRGLWFSHIGWMLRSYPSGVADYATVRDLQKDPILAFQDRWYLPLALGMNILLPLALGWLHGDLWGVFLLAGVLRLVVSHHFTFLINSARARFRAPAVQRRAQRARQRMARLPDLRRGLPQFSPPVRPRLPQRHPLVAVGPEQVDHLLAVLARAHDAPAPHAGGRHPACAPDNAVPPRAGEPEGARGRAAARGHRAHPRDGRP